MWYTSDLKVDLGKRNPNRLPLPNWEHTAWPKHTGVFARQGDNGYRKPKRNIQMKTSCWTQQGALLMNPYKMPTSSEMSLFTHKSTQTNTANTTAISNLFQLGLPQKDAEEKFLLTQRSYRKALQWTVQQFCSVCCQEPVCLVNVPCCSLHGSLQKGCCRGTLLYTACKRKGNWEKKKKKAWFHSLPRWENREMPATQSLEVIHRYFY